MRRVLGNLVAHLLGVMVLLFAAGCGSGGGDSTTEPDDRPSAEPALVAILSGSAAGGEASLTAIDLGSPAGVDRLVSGVEHGSLAYDVRAKVAATEVPDGRRLVGAIVAVGCDIPVDVKVAEASDPVRLEPVFEGKPIRECFAAVTSIALVLLDAEST